MVDFSDFADKLNNKEYQENESSYPLLPEGSYLAEVIETKYKDVVEKGSEKILLIVSFILSDDSGNESKFNSRFALNSPNIKEQNMGRVNLVKLYNACGYSSIPKEHGALVGHKLKVDMIIKEGKYNNIKSFENVGLSNGRIKEQKKEDKNPGDNFDDIDL